MKLLDVGGGFVEKYFEDAANDINHGIEEFFGGKNITVIAEPGKYFSASVVSSCFTVVGKRTRVFDGVMKIDYVISDGINGTFCHLPLAEDNEAIPIYLERNKMVKLTEIGLRGTSMEQIGTILIKLKTGPHSLLKGLQASG